MDPRLLALPTAFGLAGASGLNASLPLLIISFLARLGLVHLAPPFDALQSDVAFYGILCVALVEFSMDKVPAVDSVGHFLMAPLAAASGAIVFAAQSGPIRQLDPGLTVVMSLLIGAGTATAVHLTRATGRPVANVALMGPVLSLFEDISSVVISVTMMLAAVLLPLIAVGLVLAVWALWRWRSQQRTELAMRQWRAYQAGHGYAPPQAGYGYPPPQAGYGYPPPQAGYGYPPPQAGYWYSPPQAGYRYPPPQARPPGP